jgi:hypothetical protein
MPLPPLKCDDGFAKEYMGREGWDERGNAYANNEQGVEQPNNNPKEQRGRQCNGTISHPGKSKFSPCEEPNHAVTMADSAIVASQERSICPR